MTSETNHLQRMSDEQVNARLAAYADGGNFEKSLRWLWSEAGDIVESACRQHFGEKGGEVAKTYLTRPFDAAWVQTVAKQGRLMFISDASVPDFIATRARMIKD